MGRSDSTTVLFSLSVPVAVYKGQLCPAKKKERHILRRVMAFELSWARAECPASLFLL